MLYQVLQRGSLDSFLCVSYIACVCRLYFGNIRWAEPRFHPGRALCLLVFLILPGIPVSAQSGEESNFFIAPLAEIIGYSRKGPAYGGGISFGMGEEVGVGFRLLYTTAAESFNTLEIAAFFRVFPLGLDEGSGFFVQIITGQSIHARERVPTSPSESGTFSAGLGAGWRFALDNHWYVEPAVRAGYPYIAGAGVSAGLRF